MSLDYLGVAAQCRQSLARPEVSPPERYQIAGEALYSVVYQHCQTKHPCLERVTGKVTGMLLEEGVESVLELLDDPSLLAKRCEEATNLLGATFGVHPVTGLPGSSKQDAEAISEAKTAVEAKAAKVPKADEDDNDLRPHLAGEASGGGAGDRD